MAGIFGEFLCGLRFPGKKEKSKKFRGKFGARFGEKSGAEIRKIRGPFVLHAFNVP